MLRYDETVRFHPVVEITFVLGALLLLVVHLKFVPFPAWVSVAIMTPLFALPLLFGRLRVRVDESTLTVQFGYLGWPVQRIPLDEIAETTRVEYRPIRNFGGWGIRVGRLDGKTISVYSVRGTTGVALDLTRERRIAGFKTRHFLVGSVEPDKLLAALRSG